MNENQEAIQRAHEEQGLMDLHAKYSGFKPLMIWYSVWTGLLTWGAFTLFATKNGTTPGLVCLGLAVASALYAIYLFRGGLHRAWFFIF